MVVDIVTRAEAEAPKVTRYRRMPPLFSAHAGPSNLLDAAHNYALEYGPTEHSYIEWAKVMVSFSEGLREVSKPSDGDKQRACDEAHGHVLKVEGNDIICTTCNARWQGVPY